MKTAKPEIQKVTAPLMVWDPQGGHCNGSYGWYQRTRPAKPAEYADALAKLSAQYAPEYRIVVAHRITRTRKGGN